MPYNVMQLKRYRRVAGAAGLGLLLSVLTLTWPNGVLGLLVFPPYVLGGLASGNQHAPLLLVVYLALWGELTFVGYGLSVIFFPREARSQ